MAATTMFVRSVGEKNTRLAFGMMWSTLKRVGREADEIRELAKDNKVTSYARSTKGHSEDALIGLPINLDASDLKGKVYSAAQAFASMDGVQDHSMMIWRFEDDLVWVCRIKNGLPMVGKDKVMPASEVAGFINEEHSFSDYSITTYGNWSGEPEGLNIEDIAFACGRDDEIRAVPGFKLTLPKILTLVLILGSVGGGYVYNKDKAAREEAARQAAMAQQVSASDQYVQAIKTNKSGTPAAVRWAELQDAINGIQLVSAGWALDRIDCDVEVANSCTVTWKREIGSNLELNSELNLPEDTQWSLDAGKVTYQVKLPDAAKDSNFGLAESPSIRDYLKNFVSQIQDASLAGLNISLKNGLPYGIPAGVTLGDISPDVLVTAGEWEMRGEIWLAEYAFNLPANMVLKSFSVNVENADIKFSMKGNYYAKK
ncbi:type 4b pilus protein PilO2 [Methylobacillus sp. Pita2]|uniref:type 4b pilus protein PilO2 n=1 Tax=Methylobacillus sp. Pita2 TaxID=3383245 RepID=UPI0038B48CD0